jgi:hypothetical protein
MRSAVLAIRAGTEATSPLTQWLGGQHGEEEKDESSGEEGCEEDQARPQEEVGSRHFSVFDFRSDVDDRVTRTGGCLTGE